MTITPCLKKRYSTDNHGIINIRITQNRKSKYISTKVSILERYWNPNKKEVRSSYDKHESINDLIESEIDKIKKDRSLSTSHEVVSNVKKSFLTYFEEYLERLTKQEKYGSYKKFNTTLQHLRGYNMSKSKSDLLFSEVDYQWVEGFREYLTIKHLKKNTQNNYLKCCQRLYNLSIKEKVFKTYENPFDQFKFKREKVEKRFLTFDQLQYLVSHDLKKGSVVEETRNRFLVQIYGQGLRVSDLLTLRYKNLNFDGHSSRINFTQFKTKKSHSVQLSYDLMKQLFYHFDRDLYFKFYETEKYSFNFDGKKKNWTFPQIERNSKTVRDNDKKNGTNLLEKYSKEVYRIVGIIFMKQHDILRDYSIENPNKFIVTCLNERYFENVEFNDNTNLTKTQYNHIQSKITVYNRNLKKLSKLTGTNIRITSHTPRHTFTNLLLTEGTDVYSISKSLGHSRLSITENYLKDFDTERVDSDNTMVFRKINLHRITLK
ncbi:MAG: site-specific integrase [Crocinitomicaceae bacterium]|nr:site-specific integrase [Crocinitomicaceae bacterium]